MSRNKEVGVLLAQLDRQRSTPRLNDGKDFTARCGVSTRKRIVFGFISRGGVVEGGVQGGERMAAKDTS